MKIEYHCIQGHWKAIATLQNEPKDLSFIQLIGQGATRDQATDNLIDELLSVLDDFETLLKKLDR